VAGYSRLIGADEGGPLELLKPPRVEIIDLDVTGGRLAGLPRGEAAR
jgi:hypothetical protein